MWTKRFFCSPPGALERFSCIIQEKSLLLQNTGEDMASSMSQTASAIGQISTSIDGIQEGISGQAAPAVDLPL